MPIEIVLFDIGNTLIVDDGSSMGRMIDWKVLTPVSQAIEAIGELSQKVSCYAASNAGDSTNDEAMRALEKAGYSGCFSGVFTQRSTGYSKTEKTFYQSILDHINIQAHDVLMVGDHLLQDVSIPAEVGFQTCLFNPEHKINSSALMPLQNGEFSTFKDLGNCLTTGLHPSLEVCFGWLLANGATQGIFQHVMMVAAVAYELALRFGQEGLVIDPILTHRGGLLHDIDKLNPLTTRENHGALGADFLDQKELHQLADIVRYHVPSEVWTDSSTPKTWEQKLVFYADKLVNHQMLVSLEERMAELMKRYPENIKNFSDNLPHIKNLEMEIMSVINESPESYLKKIKVLIKGK